MEQISHPEQSEHTVAHAYAVEMPYLMATTREFDGFAECPKRVSTIDQTTEKQKLEIKSAGFAIEARWLIEESMSGSVAAKERPGFTDKNFIRACKKHLTSFHCWR